MANKVKQSNYDNSVQAKIDAYVKQKQQNQQKNKKKKEWYEEFINVERIKNVDSFGDALKVTGQTMLDAAGNAWQGVFQGAEGLADFVENRYADVADNYANAGTAYYNFLGQYTDPKNLKFIRSAADALRKSASDARAEAAINQTQAAANDFEHILAGDLGYKKSDEEIKVYEDIHQDSVLGDSGRGMVQSMALNATTAALNSASGGSLGIPLIAISAAGNAEQEALNTGATAEEALTYGILSGGIEAGTELLFGGLGKISEGLGFGKGAIDDQLIKQLNKKIKSTAIKNLASYTIKAGGEGLEEVLAGYGNAYAKKLTYMSEEDIKKLIKDEDLLNSFIMGTLSSTIMQAPSTITATAQGRDVNTGLTQVQQEYVNEIAQQRLAEAQKRNEKLSGYQQMKIEDRTLEDFQKGRLFDSSRLPMSDNLKSMDLQQSAYKYGINPNSEAVVNIKAMLDNRGVKSRFDAAIFEEKGIDGNAFWSNKNGVREVVFNPNASMDTIVEEIAIHELTHDLMSSSNSKTEIENQKILDYVSTLDGYAESRKNVIEKYKDQIKNKSKSKQEAYINEEIVADTLGKNIGSQEYIRQLVDSQPKLSKVIYNWIVKTVNNLANKNGVKKERLYWENIKNNFEKAYNMDWEGKGKKTDSKYSIGGYKAIEQLEESKYKEHAIKAYKKANQMQQSGKYTNEDIRKETKWFQDKNGDWKFEISDSSMSLTEGLDDIKPGKEYSVTELFDHKLLTELYPSLKDYKIVFENLDGTKKGSHNTEKKLIRINANMMNYKNLDSMNKAIAKKLNMGNYEYAKTMIEGTLLHEIQHAIQEFENFETGKNAALFRKAYYESLGEIEANDTKMRYILERAGKLDRIKKAPESSKALPIHKDLLDKSNLDRYLNKRSDTRKFLDNLYDKYGNQIDKIMEKAYNFFSKKGMSNEEIDSLVEKYEDEVVREDNRNILRRGATVEGTSDSSFFVDNKRRKLTKEQQEFFKDSKVRDDNGNLLRVYHGGSIGDATIFDKSKIGQNLYPAYGKGFYFSNKKGVSEGYNSAYGDENKSLKTVYLNITNPYYASDSDVGYINTNKLKEQGYDGVIHYGGLENEYVAFEPNQIKNIDNLNPTEDADIRYSLSDNEGKKLTKEQQNYFKDSKVRDEKGRLLVMYRGDTGETINIFDKNKSRKSNLYGTGFYFADENMAGIYGDTTPYYLNIINPLYVNKDTHSITKEQYSKFIKLAIENEDYSFENYGNISTDELINKLYDGRSDFKLINDVVATAMGDYRDAFEIFEKANGIKYDGIISNSQTVVYDSNQIKNIDNLNPTSDEDIRKSQQNENWQSFLDKNFETKGTKTRLGDIKLPGLQNAIQEEVVTQTQQALLPIANELKELNKNLNKVMNPSEIAQLTPQDANTTPNLPGIIRNKESDGKSKFFDNVNNKVGMLNDNQKAAILNKEDVKYYDKVTNKDSLDEAFERLQENGANESLRWFNSKSENATATDVAEGWILLKQYADSGNTEGMVEVAKKMREIGTKAGQTIQAFNILSRLTPEGMVKYAQSELTEAFEHMVEGKSAKWIEENKSKFDLKPEEVQFIMDTMQEVSTMEDGYDKRFKLAQIQKMMTDKLPPVKGAGIKAWMRISMLFNPKTQVRNVAGNAVIAPINAFGDLFASGADKLIAKKTGVRTTGNFNLKTYSKGMKKGLYESYNDFKHGVNTRNIQGNRFEITEGKSFRDDNVIGKALNKVDRLLSFMLDAGDRGFYEASFVNSINNQLVLNNTTEVTQEMIDIATQEALSRTWQDNNKYTKFVLSVRNQLNQINVAGYGLGDVLIPFAKTPANLTKAIVDYSPVGLIGTINKGFKLNRSLTNGQYSAQLQHDFVQSLGKSVAGTALYILGVALANAGVTTGESDEDKDVANFMKNTMGINSYSIKIGDKTFTYDWAQPLAAPLSITANLVQKQKEEATLLENITSTLDTAGNLLLEQSFMESINTVLNNNEGIATGIQEAILDLPSRAIPTFFKQIVDMTDGTQRQSFVKGKPIESSINAVKAKIPGLSQTLAPSVDTMGRDIEKYGGKNNIFNVFVNPANVNTENISESAQEIYRVYKATGEKNVMPRVAPYSLTIDNKKINLTASQRTDYQRVSGEIIENNVQNLLGTNEYQNMSDKAKAEVINNIVNYSYNIAQKEVLGKELSETYERAYEYSQIGDVSDFYTFRESIDDTDANTKKVSIRNYLVNSYLNDEQIAYLYGGYYSSDKELNLMLDSGVSMKEFVKFNSEEFTADYDRYGNVISNSRQNKIIKYVNGLNLTFAQKAILVKNEYNSYDKYDRQIFNHINGLNYSSYDKMVMLKKLGFDNYDNQIIAHVNSQNITRDEKLKILKEMGFSIRNGRVYS